MPLVPQLLIINFTLLSRWEIRTHRKMPIFSDFSQCTAVFKVDSSPQRISESSGHHSWKHLASSLLKPSLRKRPEGEMSSWDHRPWTTFHHRRPWGQRPGWASGDQLDKCCFHTARSQVVRVCMYELGEEYLVFKYGVLLLFTICLSPPHNQWHLIREGLFS